MAYTAINFAQKFGLFAEQWQPKVVAEMNDYQFKIVRLAGSTGRASPEASELELHSIEVLVGRVRRRIGEGTGAGEYQPAGACGGDDRRGCHVHFGRPAGRERDGEEPLRSWSVVVTTQRAQGLTTRSRAVPAINSYT